MVAPQGYRGDARGLHPTTLKYKIKKQRSRLGGIGLPPMSRVALMVPFP